jgi:hypothetical protein
MLEVIKCETLKFKINLQQPTSKILKETTTSIDIGHGTPFRFPEMHQSTG